MNFMHCDTVWKTCGRKKAYFYLLFLLFFLLSYFFSMSQITNGSVVVPPSWRWNMCIHFLITNVHLDPELRRKERGADNQPNSGGETPSSSTIQWNFLTPNKMHQFSGKWQGICSALLWKNNKILFSYEEFLSVLITLIRMPFCFHHKMMRKRQKIERS